MGYGGGVQASAMISFVGRRRSEGFTLVEVVILVTLGTVVALALYRTVEVQQRFYRQQRAANTAHDALRLGWSVVAADLMEASSGEGDFRFVAPESVGVRSPVGFGVVCAVDAANRVLGLFHLQGRVSTTPGDSLLIYRPAGWVVRRIESLTVSGSPMSCPYGAGGPTLERRVRVDGPVDEVPVGAPVRAFHRYTYRLEEARGSWWLARDDGATTDILAGPFTEVGSGLVFAYFDSLGQATLDPAGVARVDLTLVADAKTATKLDSLDVSASPRNQ